jgi:hypothetical protein
MLKKYSSYQKNFIESCFFSEEKSWLIPKTSLSINKINNDDIEVISYIDNSNNIIIPNIKYIKISDINDIKLYKKFYITIKNYNNIYNWSMVPVKQLNYFLINNTQLSINKILCSDIEIISYIGNNNKIIIPNPLIEYVINKINVLLENKVISIDKKFYISEEIFYDFNNWKSNTLFY